MERDGDKVKRTVLSVTVGMVQVMTSFGIPVMFMGQVWKTGGSMSGRDTRLIGADEASFACPFKVAWVTSIIWDVSSM